MPVNLSVKKYLEGLTSFVFDDVVLERIIIDRGASSITDSTQLSQMQKDLMFADLLFTAYCSPNIIASQTSSHGSFSKSIGAQTVDRDALYKIFTGIYNRYDDAKADDCGGLKWM